MMALLSRLPGWAPILVAAVIGAALAWWVQSLRWDASESRMARAHAEQVEEWATAANEAVQAEIARGNRRIEDMEKNRVQAQQLASAARADADRARADVTRLRADLDEIRAHASSRDPALADGSPAGASTAGVLAYMLGRAIDRAQFLASFADRARIAGLTCERAYDSLRE